MPQKRRAAPVTNKKAAQQADPSQLPLAIAAPLPRTLSPQLATLVKEPPTGDVWIFEAKLDGYRVLARVENGRTRLVTRNGNDWTEKMPALASEIGQLALQSGWIDGEIVVMDS